MSNSKQQIIGLCGYSGAGKTTLAKIIERDNTCLYVQRTSTGDAIRRMMENKGIEINHFNLQIFNEKIKNKLCERYISIVYEDIDPSADLVIIDSLRTMDDYNELKKIYGTKFKLIGVSCEKEVRFERMVLRGRDGDTTGSAEFDEQTIRELNWGVDKLLEMADRMIDNSSTEDNFAKSYLC